MKKFAAIIGLTIIFLFVGYLETGDLDNKDSIVVSGINADEEVNVTVEDELIDNLNLSLEMKLIDSQIINGNTVETYREYEVYRDDVGNIVKKIPTDNYEYLEYWR